MHEKCLREALKNINVKNEDKYLCKRFVASWKIYTNREHLFVMTLLIKSILI